MEMCHFTSVILGISNINDLIIYVHPKYIHNKCFMIY